jgi:hypothetical protein
VFGGEWFRWPSVFGAYRYEWMIYRKYIRSSLIDMPWICWCSVRERCFFINTRGPNQWGETKAYDETFDQIFHNSHIAIHAWYCCILRNFELCSEYERPQLKYMRISCESVISDSVSPIVNCKVYSCVFSSWIGYCWAVLVWWKLRDRWWSSVYKYFIIASFANWDLEY